MKPITKKTTKWRQRRLRLEAIKFGHKFYERLHAVGSVSNISESPLVVTVPENDELTATEKNISDGASEGNRMISSADVACALVLFKRRYRLSNACMNHLLQFLPQIPLKALPSNWSEVKMLLQTNSIVSPPLTSSICSKCSQFGQSGLVCSACEISGNPSSVLVSFHNFSVSDQLHRIVYTNFQYMNLQKKSNSDIMSDIYDGNVYQRLQRSCSDLFVTLSLNVDGVQPHRSSKNSIWPVLLIVNELPMARRFSPENIILAGIWSGPTKPNRTQMALFLRPLVDELERLERGDGFFLKASNLSQSNQLIRIRVFLIGACCDKQAQALVQNLPEPIAAFGCGRCELEGFMVSTRRKSGYVRSFAAKSHLLSETIERSNIRYDVLLALKEHRDSERAQLSAKERKRQEIHHKKKNCGILGPCILRACSMFDVGSSFMSDSLHNVYIGAFKRMLSLWLSPEYRSEAWNVNNRIDDLTRTFKRLRLPSTTTRLPRALTEYSNFKANELRVLLLFGYVIFAKVLPKKYYHHLLQLVCLLHLAENRRIISTDIITMQKLGENFVVSFPKLYTDRHCVQVVHSVYHIASTVRDFGPMTNYTTFNFEHHLGLLTRTCHSTRRHAAEIITNFQTLQCAHQHLQDSTINTDFKHFLLSTLCEDYSIDSSYTRPTQKTMKGDTLAKKLFPNKEIKFYHRLQVGKITICTYLNATSKIADDSTIVFRVQNQLQMGRVRSIFTAGETDTTFLLVDFPTNFKYFTCFVDKTEEIKYSSIQRCLKKDLSVRLLETSQIIEKCTYFEDSDGECQFMRFPNLQHSS